MTLKLFDDLLEPFGVRTLGKQHRLWRAGIVRKRLGHRQHDVEESIFFRLGATE